MCMYFLQCCPSYASLLPADPQDVVRLCGKSMNITVQEVGGEELTQHEQSIQRCLQDYRWVLVPPPPSNLLPPSLLPTLSLTRTLLLPSVSLSFLTVRIISPTLHMGATPHGGPERASCTVAS